MRPKEGWGVMGTQSAPNIRQVQADKTQKFNDWYNVWLQILCKSVESSGA